MGSTQKHAVECCNAKVLPDYVLEVFEPRLKARDTADQRFAMKKKGTAAYMLVSRIAGIQDTSIVEQAQVEERFSKMYRQSANFPQIICSTRRTIMHLDPRGR